MPSGQVGGGHQNRWKEIGDFFQQHPKPTEDKPIPFRKTAINESTTRNDSPCWTAGTPLGWDKLVFEDDVVKVEKDNPGATTANVAGVDMLVTRHPETQEIVEYHPVITFFNEVMSRIFKEDKTMLNKLETEAEAMVVWHFLERTFLNK